MVGRFAIATVAFFRVADRPQVWYDLVLKLRRRRDPETNRVRKEVENLVSDDWIGVEARRDIDTTLSRVRFERNPEIAKNFFDVRGTEVLEVDV